MPLVCGFFSPASSFRHCSIFTSIILIGSHDLDVKSRPNLFTNCTLRANDYPPHKRLCRMSPSTQRNEDGVSLEKAPTPRHISHIRILRPKLSRPPGPRIEPQKLADLFLRGAGGSVAATPRGHLGQPSGNMEAKCFSSSPGLANLTAPTTADLLDRCHRDSSAGKTLCSRGLQTTVLVGLIRDGVDSHDKNRTRNAEHTPDTSFPRSSQENWEGKTLQNKANPRHGSPYFPSWLFEDGMCRGGGVGGGRLGGGGEGWEAMMKDRGAWPGPGVSHEVLRSCAREEYVGVEYEVVFLVRATPGWRRLPNRSYTPRHKQTQSQPADALPVEGRGLKPHETQRGAKEPGRKKAQRERERERGARARARARSGGNESFMVSCIGGGGTFSHPRNAP
ncbi:hypothetical protein PR048_002789 [Dryococelus australis]|uniref:Uncharacterized protein n=1 Tax=Dryococelus australis TaxID=614101 RepID=A0ABQ9ING5_9NEOP|nr:hypothetical protein PR048_002789 [Dryococelus australis]